MVYSSTVHFLRPGPTMAILSFICDKSLHPMIVRKPWMLFKNFPLLSLTMYDVFDSLIISLIFSLNWISSIYLHITWRAWEFYLYHLDSNSEHSWQQKPCFDWPTFMQILWENGHRQGLTKLWAQVPKEIKKKIVLATNFKVTSKNKYNSKFYCITCMLFTFFIKRLTYLLQNTDYPEQWKKRKIHLFLSGLYCILQLMH